MKQNPILAYFQNLSIEELKQMAVELQVLGNTGVLPPGLVRIAVKKIKEILGYDGTVGAGVPTDYMIITTNNIKDEIIRRFATDSL